jgi:hypothetical protein
MNRWLLYTGGGSTYDEAGDEVENLQVLDLCVIADTMEQAIASYDGSAGEFDDVQAIQLL